MEYNDEDDEIECEIIKSYGIFATGTKNWNKEVNLVSWNGKPAKLDIRSWQKNHSKCGKGITLTRAEAEELVKLLDKVLKARSERADTQTRKRAKQKPEVPITLQPFYDELELLFGAGPGECKTARNTLLKKYHPDTNAQNIHFATRKTITIKEAYEKIMAWWRGNGLVS